MFHDQIPFLVKRSLQSGYAVIVDAFLRRQERRLMTDLADAMERAWAIVHCMCTDTTARQRLEQRQREGLDPSEADQIVRDRQRQWIEPRMLGNNAEPWWLMNSARWQRWMPHWQPC